MVHELGQNLASKLRIRQDLPFGDNATSWHRMCSSNIPALGGESFR
ncbi:hypothetical protein ADG881_1593 [Alcanivorax sp. DG881]|nr:hypothetical protein ADG881_1593 [Alcanivorax sp. DG881]